MYEPVDALQSPRYSGPRTFGRLPHVETTEDVDVALFGIPWDSGTSYRPGARFGPEAVRSASALLRPYNPAQDVMVWGALSCVDYGDAPTVPGYIEDTLARIHERPHGLLEERQDAVHVRDDDVRAFVERDARGRVADELDAVGEAVRLGDIARELYGVARLHRENASRTQAAGDERKEPRAGADVHDDRIGRDRAAQRLEERLRTPLVPDHVAVVA